MMAASCCKSWSQLVVETNHVEWMKNLPSELHDEPITKIAIPGTHDSFAFQLSHHPGPDLDANLKRIYFLISPIIKNWSITQNLTFTEQLYIGIRYFDLRVCRTTNVFTFTHGLLGGLVRDGLEEINEFLNKYPQEIVLLDFNHFYDFNDQYGHEQLIELIHEIFGNKICTTADTILECTLNYLWSHRQQVILLYGQNYSANDILQLWEDLTRRNQMVNPRIICKINSIISNSFYCRLENERDYYSARLIIIGLKNRKSRSNVQLELRMGEYGRLSRFSDYMEHLSICISSDNNEMQVEEFFGQDLFGFRIRFRGYVLTKSTFSSQDPSSISEQYPSGLLICLFIMMIHPDHRAQYIKYLKRVEKDCSRNLDPY